MACETSKIRILDYVENTLPPAELGAIESHLAQCATCREFALQLREIDAALASGIKAPRLSGEFNQRLRQRIQAETRLLSEEEQRKRQQELQAEFEAGRLRLRKRVLGIAGWLDLLAYAAVGGLAGWILFEFAPALAMMLNRLMSQSFGQSMLLPMAAGVLCLLFGLFTVFRQRYSKGVG